MSSLRRFSPMFFSRNFIDFYLAQESVVQVRLIFARGVYFRARFILLVYGMSQLFWYHLLKTSFLHQIAFVCLSKIIRAQSSPALSRFYFLFY